MIDAAPTGWTEPLNTRLLSSSAIATIMPAPDVTATLTVLALGLVEAHRGFDKVLDGVRYAGSVFDGGRYYGLAAVLPDEQHGVAITRQQIDAKGAPSAVTTALDELRAWVAANV